MRLTLLLPLLLVACPSGSGDYPSVTVNGKTLLTEYVRTDPDRRDVLTTHAGLTPGRAILIGYAEERLLHHFTQEYEDKAGSSASYDVAWLNKDRVVVETGALAGDSEAGVSSTQPAAFALFVPSGWLKDNGVATGQTVRFSPGIAANTPEPLPELKVGGVPVRVEVSAGYWNRQRGLMHRKALSPDTGMLFIYGRPKVNNFWMKNCYFPIDIAFFDETGKFLNVVPTQPWEDPRKDPSVRSQSTGESKYVLEVDLGWFQKKGLVDKDHKPVKEIRLELPSAVAAMEADP